VQSEKDCAGKMIIKLKKLRRERCRHSSIYSAQIIKKSTHPFSAAEFSVKKKKHSVRN
jgi:hypothetical protein